MKINLDITKICSTKLYFEVRGPFFFRFSWINIFRLTHKIGKISHNKTCRAAFYPLLFFHRHISFFFNFRGNLRFFFLLRNFPELIREFLQSMEKKYREFRQISGKQIVIFLSRSLKKNCKFQYSVA